MSEFNVSIPAGESKRLLTSGKYCPADILVTAEKPEPVEEKDVNFYDYDGTLLYSYTVAEAQALSELPPLPEHDGLICQGWNWTLAGIKALDRQMQIGATYITNDGATRLKIRIATTGRMDLPLYFSQTVENGVFIDWGDGSQTETIAGTGYVNTSHSYSAVGNYTISLLPLDSCELGLGSNANSSCVFGASTNARVYSGMLLEVYVGNNVPSLSNYVFMFCNNLTVCTIPNSTTSFGAGVFYQTDLHCFVYPYGCTAMGGAEMFRENGTLVAVSLSETVTVLANSAFRACHGLSRLGLPNGVKTILITLLYDVRSIGEIAFPGSIMEIRAQAFINAYGMKVYDFTRFSSVPTLANINVFTNHADDIEIRVPSTLYDEWIVATNWATYADYIVGV